MSYVNFISFLDGATDESQVPKLNWQLRSLRAAEDLVNRKLSGSGAQQPRLLGTVRPHPHQHRAVCKCSLNGKRERVCRKSARQGDRLA